MGVVLAGVVLAAAQPISQFYAQPELVDMLWAVSGIFVLNGFATQYEASLSRSLRFVAIAVAETGSMVIATVVSVLTAAAGAGYWSLVIMQIMQSVSALGILLIASRWMPRWYRLDARMGALLRFGVNQMIAQVINYASRNVDTIVVGARFGATQLGFYNNAYLLLRLPLNQISTPASSVALPVLSRLQDDRRRFDSYLLRGQVVVLHLVAFAFALIASQAHSAVAVVLGPQWAPTADLLVIMAAGGLFQAAGSATQWTMLALGHSGSLLRLMLTTRSAMTALILLGSIWGVAGVAWAYSASCLLVWLIGLIWIAVAFQAPWRELTGIIVRTVCGYGLCFLASVTISRLAPEDLPAVRLALGVAAMVTMAIVVMAVWPAFRRDVRSALAVASYVKSRAHA